jgi:gluconate 2-dehydrogenase
MKQQIILYSKIPDTLKARLEEEFELHFFDGITNENYSEFMNKFAKAHGLIGYGSVFDADLLSYAKNLKAISTISVTYDNFDVEYLTRNRILLLHTPNVLAFSTADIVFALILNLARKVISMNDLIKENKWQREISPEDYGIDVHHKTIGIIGAGKIGTAVAKRAYGGFDMEVLYVNNQNNQFIEDEYHAKKCTLEQLLAQSDFVVIATTSNYFPEKMIDLEKIKLMKNTAFLINVSRGNLINCNDLYDSLQDGTILGAGLDILELDYLMQKPLVNLPNVIALPNISSATYETRYKMAERAVSNLISALRGAVNKNVVNSHQLYNYSRN